MGFFDKFTKPDTPIGNIKEANKKFQDMLYSKGDLDESTDIKDFYDKLSKINTYETQALRAGDHIFKEQSREALLADLQKAHPNRKIGDQPPVRGAVHKGERKDRLNIRRALQEGTEKKAARDVAEAKALAEAEAGTLKGRLKAAWNDADTRDAILGGLQESLTATKYGKEVYGSRLADIPTNIRANLKRAEATKIARNKAQVDAMKVMAETNKLLDPRQYLSNAQKEADSYVQAQIRAGKISRGDYDSAYARMLKQIAVKDLTSAKSGSIKDLYTYAMALEATDPVTANILKDAIRSNAMYLAGDGTEFGAQTDAANEIIVKDTVTTTN
jgi:hypothetical protein